jgi:hypothetical protein
MPGIHKWQGILNYYGAGSSLQLRCSKISAQPSVQYSIVQGLTKIPDDFAKQL